MLKVDKTVTGLSTADEATVRGQIYFTIVDTSGRPIIKENGKYVLGQSGATPAQIPLSELTAENGIVSIGQVIRGNLADLMDSLSSVIRDRMRLNKRIRVLTAQTQMSKSILIIMPILSFIVLNILNPGYMEPLYTTPEGNALMVVMIVSILTGSWIMNKMIRKHLLA